MKKYSIIFISILGLVAAHNNSFSQKNDSHAYSVVDQKANPIKGFEDLSSYIVGNLKYPKNAKKAGIEGIVHLEFIINKSGEIEKMKVVKGIGYGCDEESLRILHSYPDKWTLAKHEGKLVKQKMVLPIMFKLGKNIHKKKDSKS